MSAIFGNVELLLITDPNWLIQAPLADAYYVAGTTWFTERIATDAINDAADISIAGIVAALLSAGVAFEYQQLAEDYYDIYDRQRQFYYANFQNNSNGELGLLAQTFSIPLYTPQYTPQATVVEAFASSGAFSGKWWQDRANMYHDAPFTTSLNAYGNTSVNGEPESLDLGAIVSDFDTYFYRYEEHRQDVYNERRWEWQNQALNFGVKQASVVESGLATSFKFLDEASENMGDWFATQSNGLSKQSAYRSSLASTSAKLSASSQMGRSLSISTNLGNDIGRKRKQVPYNNDMSSMFMNEEDSMTYQSIQN
jgi:hypothetical protein